MLGANASVFKGEISLRWFVTHLTLAQVALLKIVSLRHMKFCHKYWRLGLIIIQKVKKKTGPIWVTDWRYIDEKMDFAKF